jgi:predicted RND superfamily exporter protein
MTTSAFKMNGDLGLMTILSIVGALILDFLFLPALLLLGRNKEQPELADDPKLLSSPA